MKKKGIIVIAIIILLGIILTTMFVSKNSQKYIMQDGMMLALTLDGESITSFPERGEYEVYVDCGETATGKWLAEEWKLAIEDITGNVKCNVEFYRYPLLLSHQIWIDIDETCYQDSALDDLSSISDCSKYTNGLRYSGKTPNNWIWFNGEKWRIIGLIPTKTASRTENLVKIIRSEMIEMLEYDASSTPTVDWGSNTLYSLLNTHYYATNKNEMNGQNHVGCFSSYSSQQKQICDYSEIGIMSDSYYGRMVENVYWNTGGLSSNTITPNTAYTEEITSQTVSGYVGLTTASDCGYASDSSFHDTTMSSNESAVATNWLHNGRPLVTLNQLPSFTFGSKIYLVFHIMAVLRLLPPFLFQLDQSYI